MVYKAADSKMAHLRTSEGRSSGGLFGFIRSIEAMQDKLRISSERVNVAFEDRGAVARRQAIQPDYKADRDHAVPFWREAHRGACERWALASGYTVMTMPQGEADDCIASRAWEISAIWPDDNVVIMSRDHDFKKLLSLRVYILFRPDENPYTIGTFLTEYGFDPQFYLDYCALAGDSSDNVKGLVSGAEARKIILEPELLAEWHNTSEGFKRNLSVLGFHEGDLEKVSHPGGPDLIELADLYREWEFASLLKKRGLV